MAFLSLGQPAGKGLAMRAGITRTSSALSVDASSASSTHGCGWGVGDELRRDVEYSLLEGLHRGVLMPLPVFVPTPENSASLSGSGPWHAQSHWPTHTPTPVVVCPTTVSRSIGSVVWPLGCPLTSALQSTPALTGPSLARAVSCGCLMTWPTRVRHRVAC